LEVLEKLSTKAALEAEQRAHEIIEMAEIDYNRIQGTTNLLNSVETDYKEEVVCADNKNALINESHNDNDMNISFISSPPSFLPDDFKDHPHIANISPSKPDEKYKIKNTKDFHTDDQIYSYYQSEDGQHIYLHPLDIRVLKQEFGSYDHFPDEITVRVVGVDESTMTEVLLFLF
jgi:hypothetical protein